MKHTLEDIGLTEADIVTLRSDDGPGEEGIPLFEIEIDGKSYVAIANLEDMLDDDRPELQIYPLLVDTDGSYVYIASDAEYNYVIGIMRTALKEAEEDVN